MKKCSNCGETKELSEFPKNKSNKDGLRIWCKFCSSVKIKEWREKNKGKVKEYEKEYRLNNKEKIKEYRLNNRDKISKLGKEYREKNKDKIKEKHKEYREKNIEKLKEKSNEYYSNNKEKRKLWEKDNKDRIKKRRSEYYQKNKEEIKTRAKNYYHNNKEKIQKYRCSNKKNKREYRNNRYKTDNLFRLKTLLRCRVYQSFKRNFWRKGGSTEKLLGIPYEVAKLHIEKQFTKGMTWENNGEWHIDHIIPLSSATTEVELRKLCHYTNLQPLWAYDNMSKGDKMPEVQIRLRI